MHYRIPSPSTPRLILRIVTAAATVVASTGAAGCGVMVEADAGTQEGGPCGGHVCGVMVEPDAGTQEGGHGGPCGGNVCGLVLRPDAGK